MKRRDLLANAARITGLAGAATLTSTAGAQALRGEVPTLTRATSSAKPPDANGYLQRWLLLDPVTIPIRSNQQLTDSLVQAALTKEYFPNQFTGVPKDGDTVLVDGKELVWHALDSSDYNVNLYHCECTGTQQHVRPVSGLGRKAAEATLADAERRRQPSGPRTHGSRGAVGMADLPSAS